MVNANGYPTRTRDRNGTFITSANGSLKLDASHRFVKASSPLDQIQRQQYIESIGARLKKLTPATRRVLLAVRGAMYLEYQPGKRYVFREYVNRAAIAHALKREKLVPYDIRMLRDLCAQRFVVERKHPLPRKQHGDIWLGAGAEFVYTIPLDVLYCLLYHDPKERPHLEAIGTRLAAPQMGAAAPQKRPQSAAHGALKPTSAPHSNHEADRLLRDLDRLSKPSLLDRFLDWIGF